MQRWEYQVIRLNIEAPAPRSDPPAPAADSGSGAKGSGAPGAGGGSAQPPGKDQAGSSSGTVFSEAYLRQEFPQFYGQQPSGTPAKAQQEDAGQQLQVFLNAQGQQGWDLVGLQHAGPHTFIVFKRPAAADLQAADTQAEQLRLTLEMANRALAILERQAP